MKKPTAKPQWNGDTEAVRMKREILLQHLSFRHGKTSTELFEDFRYDYGSYNERMLWKHLRWLIDQGCVKSEGKKGAGMLYTKTTDKPPRVRRVIRCGLCGMANSSATTHPAHEVARLKAAGDKDAILEIRRKKWRERSAEKRNGSPKRPPAVHGAGGRFVSAVASRPTATGEASPDRPA